MRYRKNMPLSAGLLNSILDKNKYTQVWVALSGGMDSQVLLHLCHKTLYSIPNPPKLTAIHVNHNLSLNSGLWQEQCQQVCDQYNIPMLAHSVSVTLSGDGLESAARNARYEVFESVVQENDCLLLGHHLNDMAETMLFRLMRGAGVAGLAAMPRTRSLGEGVLIRPLLDVSRADIEVYAKEHGLSWVEDESNEDESFSRNFLRSQVLPKLQERWPSALTQMKRSAAHCEEAQTLLEEVAFDDVAAMGGVMLDKQLPLSGLLELRVTRQRNVLRAWLRFHDVLVPSEVQINEYLNQLAQADQESSPRLQLGDWDLRRYQDKVYLTPKLVEFDTSLVLEWQLNTVLTLPDSSLSASLSRGVGLRIADEQVLRVKFRQGGERIQPAGAVGSRPLKKWLQEWGIPPWLRERVPLIYLGEELVAVADYCICEGYQVTADDDGNVLNWELFC